MGVYFRHYLPVVIQSLRALQKRLNNITRSLFWFSKFIVAAFDKAEIVSLYDLVCISLRIKRFLSLDFGPPEISLSDAVISANLVM